MIDVYDDVLEEHNAILVDDDVRQISWKYDYYSDKTKLNKHWHVLCGHNEEECGELGYFWAHDLFQVFTNKFDFKKKYSIDGYVRIYCNAHTHGLEPHIHKDDGDFTMIYYPRMDWKIEWGGCTAIFKDSSIPSNLTTSSKYKKDYSKLEIDRHINYIYNLLIN